MSLSTKSLLKSSAGAVALSLPLAAFSGAPAFAVELYPKFSIEIPIEIESDTVFDSDDDDAEFTDTYATIEPEIVLSFNEIVSLNAGLVFEPVEGGEDPDPGEDIFFENHGLYAEQLFLEIAPGDFSLIAGKYNPSFGVAWDLAPGIYGVDFAEDYELTERIGLAGSVSFGGEASGEHTLTVSSFFADTTGLTESLFQDRPTVDKDDGGPSNTEDLSSFAVTLIGEDVPFLGGFGYALSFATQDQGETAADTDDETGFAVALFGGLDLTESLSVEPVIEYASFDGFGGTDTDADYITAGLAFLTGPWNLSLAYTDRSIEENGGSDFDDTLFAASAGYEFESGLTFDLGYKLEDAEDVESQVFGVLFTYTVGYSAP
ncbi:MAG: hypothetical protein AAGB03_06890 [Pseudomonadota bacterium]